MNEAAVAMALLLGVAALPLGWLARALLRERRSDRIPILCYHRFLTRELRGSPADREAGWVCYEDEFEKQMEALMREGFTTLDLDDYLAIRNGTRAAPPRGIVITMDDGYRSNFLLAYPTLARLGMKAVIFVAPEPDEHTRGQVAGIDDFLHPADLRALAAGGTQIGSHTLTHAILTELSNADVRFELDASRELLEGILDKPVEHFCFPRGGVDKRVRQLVIEAGYLSAVGANQGTATGLDGPHDLPRIMIERDMQVDDFLRILEPGQGTLTRTMGRLKRIPRQLLGARGARALRDLLYDGPLQPLFRARALRGLIVVAFTLCLFVSSAAIFALARLQ